MSVVLDAGGLIAVEAYDRDVLALLKQELLAGRTPVTHGGIVGQVLRGTGARQARLAHLLRGVRIEPLDDVLGRRAGTLLRQTRTADVIDAALVLLAVDGDRILTSDARDLERLAKAAELHVDIVPV